MTTLSVSKITAMTVRLFAACDDKTDGEAGLKTQSKFSRFGENDAPAP